jgi:hypothetical protein
MYKSAFLAAGQTVAQAKENNEKKKKYPKTNVP